MVESKRLQHKGMKVGAIGVGLGVALLLSTFVDGAYPIYGQGQDELTVVKATSLPQREISGLALAPDRSSGVVPLFSIGDKYAHIGIGGWDRKTHRVMLDEQRDISRLLIERFALCSSRAIPGCRKQIAELTSQWEGVAVDGAGSIFLLHEQLASIVAYDPHADKLLGVLNLSSFRLAEDEARRRSSRGEENALGEGLVLLSNGHVLVAKERREPSIFEFAPKGETAQGYHGGLQVGPDDVFPMAGERVDLEPVAQWVMPSGMKDCDLSELATDSKGALYFMSQKCRQIAKVAPLKADKTTLAVVKSWRLPADIKFAESFLVTKPDQEFVVGVDRKSVNVQNIYYMTAAAPAG